MLLLRTVHGSHLYGLNHAQSDFDTFEVHSNEPGRKNARNAKQKTDGTTDVLKTDLSTFIQYAQKGVPQYLEAMWSDVADVDLINDWRFSFQPDLYVTAKTYHRTIRNFWNEGSYKRRRHAWRLYFNLNSIERAGRFSPRLEEQEREFIEYALTRDIPPPVDLDESSYVYQVDTPFHLR